MEKHVLSCKIKMKADRSSSGRVVLDFEVSGDPMCKKIFLNRRGGG